MSKIKLHAGDFGNVPAKFSNEEFHFLADFRLNTVPIIELSSIEKASDESVKQLGEIIEWDAFVSSPLAPAGLSANSISKKNSTHITFVALLKDGRKFVGTTDLVTYTAIKTALCSLGNTDKQKSELSNKKKALQYLAYFLISSLALGSILKIESPILIFIAWLGVIGFVIGLTKAGPFKEGNKGRVLWIGSAIIFCAACITNSTINVTTTKKIGFSTSSNHIEEKNLDNIRHQHAKLIAKETAQIAAVDEAEQQRLAQKNE